jgi:uncharacterized protein YecT (DUF1311 family)
MRTTILCLALIPALAAAQTAPQPAPSAPRPKKVLTPDQIAYQAQMKVYYAEHARLATAATSYTAEMAREKADACPNATAAYDINLCLAHEDEITDANYRAFTAAVRAMLALPQPTFPGETTPYVGPTGPEATPATNTAAFDAAEAAWHAYATAECNAVDTLWRSGTIVNAMVGYCELRMARTRLHELNDAYEMLLYH